MQKVMVMCLLASALLAVSCATLHRSRLAGVDTEIAASMVAMGEGAHSESAEAMTLNSGALRCNIEGSER